MTFDRVNYAVTEILLLAAIRCDFETARKPLYRIRALPQGPHHSRPFRPLVPEYYPGHRVNLILDTDVIR